MFTLVDHLYGIIYVLLKFRGFSAHFLYLSLCLWWITSKERRYTIDQSLGLFPDIWQRLTEQLLKVIPVLEFKIQEAAFIGANRVHHQFIFCLDAMDLMSYLANLFEKSRRILYALFTV